MELNAVEVRVLGCLVEKQMTTPDIYPLTLNALVTACNQSTNREPVVNYDPATVTEALNHLRARHKLVRVVLSGAGSRVDKFKHVLDERLGLTPPEIAILAITLLRGPQTVNELKIRTERYHDFSSLEAIEAVITRLCDPTLDADPSEAPIRSDAGMLRSASPTFGDDDDGRPADYRRPWHGPLIERLVRQPGQKEPRVGQLLGGPIDLEALRHAASTPVGSGSGDHGGGGQRERVAQLELSVSELREQLLALRNEFDVFRSQFG